MDVQTLRTLIDYTQHTNHKLWACIDELSEAQFFQAHDYSVGGIYDQTFHMMAMDWFMPHFDEVAAGKAKPPQKTDFTTWGEIKAEWSKIEAAVNATVASFTDAQLKEIVKTPFLRAGTLETPRWEMWMSAVNHNTNHRAQVLALLFQLGARTIEQGYFFYLIDRQTTAQSA